MTIFRSDNLSLPLPLDERQVSILTAIRERGFAFASPGSESFEELEVLAEREFLLQWEGSVSLGVHQFELSGAGKDYLSNT